MGWRIWARGVVSKIRKMAGGDERFFAFDVERLEYRELLAGNVTVRDLGGALLVNGDDQGNAIAITETLDDRYMVTPLAGTTINGTASSFTSRVYAVEPRIVLRTHGGDDVVQLDNLSDLRALRADLGDGADTLIAQTIETRGSMVFNLGAGDDQLSLTAAEAKGSFSVNLGAGDNTADLTTVDGSAGRILGGTGVDAISLSDADFNRFVLNTGRGHDVVVFQGLQSETEGAVNLNLGTGDDHLELASFQARSLRVQASAGDDTVTVLSTVQVELASLFAGGSGDNDQLALLGGSFGRPPRVVQFESLAVV